MAINLIVEDGSGIADANCYTSLIALDDYAALIGADLSAYSDEQKKSAIYVAANKYIDRLHEFKGSKVSESQGMKLYTDVVTFAIAGKDVATANAEAAILHLKGFLFVDESTQDNKGDVIEESKKLDVLEKTVKYAEGSRVSTKYNTSTIDLLLKPYLSYGSAGVVLRNV